jgi:hypothetical protein
MIGTTRLTGDRRGVATNVQRLDDTGDEATAAEESAHSVSHRCVWLHSVDGLNPGTPRVLPGK